MRDERLRARLACADSADLPASLEVARAGPGVLTGAGRGAVEDDAVAERRDRARDVDLSRALAERSHERVRGAVSHLVEDDVLEEARDQGREAAELDEQRVGLSTHQARAHVGGEDPARL